MRSKDRRYSKEILFPSYFRAKLNWTFILFEIVEEKPIKKGSLVGTI